MTIEEDTEWLRRQLAREEFQERYRKEWVAARDQDIVFHTADRVELEAWITERDTQRTSVLAYADDGALA